MGWKSGYCLSFEVYCFSDTMNFLIWVALQLFLHLKWLKGAFRIGVVPSTCIRTENDHVWSCWSELSVAGSEVEWKLLCMDILLVCLCLTIAFQWLLFGSPGHRSLEPMSHVFEGSSNIVLCTNTAKIVCQWCPLTDLKCTCVSRSAISTWTI